MANRHSQIFPGPSRITGTIAHGNSPSESRAPFSADAPINAHRPEAAGAGQDRAAPAAGREVLTRVDASEKSNVGASLSRRVPAAICPAHLRADCAQISRANGSLSRPKVDTYLDLSDVTRDPASPEAPPWYRND
jgi:hypothetical protein